MRLGGLYAPLPLFAAAVNVSCLYTYRTTRSLCRYVQMHIFYILFDKYVSVGAHVFWVLTPTRPEESIRSSGAELKSAPLRGQ